MMRRTLLCLCVAAGCGVMWLGGANTEVTVHQGTMMALALSPDQRTIAIDLQGAIYTLPVGGGKATPITDLLYDAHQPSWSPDGQTLAFYSNRDDRWHIWTVRRDGSQAKQLTTGPYEDREPHWSPDGTRLAFSSNRSGNGSYDIWELTVGTGALRQVTTDKGNEFTPTYSPDGREIAYISSRNPGAGVYAVDRETQRERLINAVPTGVIGAPSWRPDGKAVLYGVIAEGTGQWMLDSTQVSTGEDVFPFRAAWLSADEFLYTADGQIKRRSLATGKAVPIEFSATLPIQPASYVKRHRDFDASAPQAAVGILHPVISPDGRQIAFAALGDLWLMPIGGGKPQRLTDDPAVETDPAWSPDGKSLAYSSDRAGSMDMYIRDLQTGKDRQVTEMPGSEEHGAWSPDGRHIAFVKVTGTQQDVFVVDVATGQSRKVHEGGFVPGYPTWSSDSRLVVSSRFTPVSSRYRQGTSQLYATPLDGGPGRLIVPLPNRSIGKRVGDGPVWSPGGKMMAFVMDEDLYVMPVTPQGDKAGEPRLVAKGPADYLSWTGDAKRVLYLSPAGLKLVAVQGGAAPQSVPLDLTWTPHIAQGRKVIHAGLLVDGVHETARQNMDVVIEGNRIRAVEPHRAELHTAGTVVVDASHQTLMPGLIEGHTHGNKSFGARFGRLFLAYGITSVRSPSNSPDEIVEEREAFESGRRMGPRVFAASYSLDGPLGFYAGALPITTTQQVDDQVEVARALQLDLLKTYVNLAEPLRKYAVERAHGIGIPVSSHELYPAASFGMDSTEHLTGTAGRGYPTKCSTIGRMYQDVIAILQASQMTITPTAILGALPERMAADPGLLTDPRWKGLQPMTVTEGVPPAISMGPDAATRTATAVGWRKAILDMSKAGVTLLAGTDSSLVPYGLSLHYEMEIEVAAGLTPFQALQTATVNPARLLNAAEDLGSVEPGKLADLVIVEGNPLEDIRNARRVRSVFRGGELLTLESILDLHVVR